MAESYYHRNTEKVSNKSQHTQTAFEPSIHGLNHIFSSNSVLFKITWMCLLFVATIGFSHHLYNLITDYLNYEYYDKIIYSKDSELVFPGVTICDTEPFTEHTILGDGMQFYISLLKRVKVGQFICLTTTVRT